MIVTLSLVSSAAFGEPAEGARLRAAVVLDDSMSMRRMDPGELAVVAARLLVDLRRHCAEGNLEQLGRTAHGFAGGCGMVGLHQLKYLSIQIEKACRTGSEETLQAAVRELEDGLRAARPSLEAAAQASRHQRKPA